MATMEAAGTPPVEGGSDTVRSTSAQYRLGESDSGEEAPKPFRSASQPSRFSPAPAHMPPTVASRGAMSAASVPSATLGYDIACEKRILQEAPTAAEDGTSRQRSERSIIAMSKLEDLEMRHAILQVELGKETEERLGSQRKCKALEVELQDVIARNTVLETERARILEFNRALNKAVMRLNGKNLDLHEYAVACEEVQALTHRMGESWEDLGQSNVHEVEQYGGAEEDEASTIDAESVAGCSDAEEAEEDSAE